MQDPSNIVAEPTTDAKDEADQFLQGDLARRPQYDRELLEDEEAALM